MWVTAVDYFLDYFPRLSGGNAPYPWQCKAFERMVEGNLPPVIPAPTGSGKTALMMIWALAFGWSRIRAVEGRAIARRLVWVVNNRVVVDQATEEAKRLRQALEELPLTDPLRGAFEDASASVGSLLAISALRGQFQDNAEWKVDPSRPAIIVGTVDLIGSNLLFRGYREGRYWRPSAAGLLGVDSFIVNDEAHLTPAFARLLEQLNEMEPAAAIPGKSFDVMALSATPGKNKNGAAWGFEADLENSERFRRVVTARKWLRIEEVGDRLVEDAVIRRALEEPYAPRTLVFINRPEKALEAWRKIAKVVGEEKVGLLTGTMRGYERDELTESALFRAFQAEAAPPAPVWLVCTAAGEVGVNITSERLVTEMTTAERLQQRLGRLNRYGAAPAGDAYLIVGKVASAEEKETLGYLESLAEENGAKDVSCQALLQTPAPREAQSPAPATARLEERVVDLWAQTSSRGWCFSEEQTQEVVEEGAVGGGRVIPEVEPWLHGKQENEAETEIAWRNDVAPLAKALREGVIPAEVVEEVLEKYRVLPHERLREPSYRVAEKLKKLAGQQESETAVLIVGRDGDVRAAGLGELVQTAENLTGRLAYRLLLLPAGCGGIEKGMFQPGASEGGTRWDVADTFAGAEERPRTRFRVTESTVEAVGTIAPDWDYSSLPEACARRAPLAEVAKAYGFGKPLVIPLGEDESGAASEWLVYFPSRFAGKGRIRTEVDLTEHLERVKDWVEDLCSRLGLEALAESFAQAAAWHDVGKDCELWQTAMGNPAGTALAKTAGRTAPRMLGGFRHEFRSLLEADAVDELAKHLIAAHHGYGRPYFEPRQYDRGGARRSNPAMGQAGGLRRSEAVALEAACRFGVLQQQFGHWGLAYLEAVFKAADALASAEEEGGTRRKGVAQ
jgi:CRISPR-associated endonuclease/helicase Cas3